MARVRVKRKKGFINSLKTFKNRFSRAEVYSILAAWFLLSLAFTKILLGSGVPTLFLLIASMIALGTGFITHELMHKFTAQKFRYYAEFRIWLWGILLMLVTSLFGFIFAAPGATYFQPDPREQFMDPKGFIKRYGTISIAGPLINFVFGSVFLGLFYLFVFLSPVLISNTGLLYLALVITGVGGYINFYLCAFNMLPINPLDGYKVFVWNKKYWAALFVVSVAISALILFGYLPLLFTLQ